MNKIKKFIKEGKLIDYDELFASYPKEYQEKVKETAKFIVARMEIKRLRQEKRLSQEALAKKMKVKREFVSRIESGRQNITLETLFRIARATGKEFKFGFE